MCCGLVVSVDWLRLKWRDSESHQRCDLWGQKTYNSSSLVTPVLSNLIQDGQKLLQYPLSTLVKVCVCVCVRVCVPLPFAAVFDSHWLDYKHNKPLLWKRMCWVNLSKKETFVNYDKLCRHASCTWSSHIESAPLLSTASWGICTRN